MSLGWLGLCAVGLVWPVASARAQEAARPRTPPQIVVVAPDSPVPDEASVAPPAQAPPPVASRTPAAPARRPAFDVKAFGLAGFTVFGASDTFDAVLGDSGGPVYGGGVVVGHRSGWFFQLGVERFSGDGERVFVHDGEVFELGIPLSVSATPIEFTGGYRFLPKPVAPRRAPPSPPRPIFKPARPLPTDNAPPPAPPQPAPPPPSRRWVPYVGGGAGVVRYSETSDFAGAGDDVDESFTSYHLLGGIDFPVWKWLGAGVEGAYRWVPDALGEEGVAAEFDETDLGGFTLRVRVTVGR